MVCSSQIKTIYKIINIKPKELQEKQLAKYKNYKKKQNKQIINKLKPKPKRKQRIKKTTTKQLKSMHIQSNKQKCILKSFLFNLFDMHLMNILMHCIVKYFSYRKKNYVFRIDM